MEKLEEVFQRYDVAMFIRGAALSPSLAIDAHFTSAVSTVSRLFKLPIDGIQRGRDHGERLVMRKTTVALRNILFHKGRPLASKRGSTMSRGNTMIHVCCQRFVLSFPQVLTEKERDALDMKKNPEMRCLGIKFRHLALRFSNEAVLCPPFETMLTASQPFDVSYVTHQRVLLT